MSNNIKLVEDSFICKITINQSSKPNPCGSEQLMADLKSFIEFQFKNTYNYNSVSLKFYNNRGEPMLE